MNKKIYIKKYQNPSNGIDWNMISKLMSQFSQGKNDINTIIDSTNFNNKTLDNSHSSRIATTNWNLGSGKGLTQQPSNLIGKKGFDINNFANIGKYADMIPKYNSENKTNQVGSIIQDTAANAANIIPGIGPAISAGLKIKGATYDTINNITGGELAVNNKETGLLSTIDNLAGSKLFGLSPFGIVNSLTKKTVEGSDTDLTKNITMGYLPTDEVEENEYGGISRLFGKKKIKNRINRVNQVNTENIIKGNTVSKAQKDQEMASNNMSNILNKNYRQLQGGFNKNQLRALSMKKGSKLCDLKNLVLKAKKGTKLPNLNSSNEEKTNVIPNGALHARKNNIEQFGNNITHKGIPVIAGDLINNGGTIELEKGGEVTQHAEIEKEEIIFHKELTNKIEVLYKKYKETNDKDILLKVGKLLTYEILENTEDNVGLLNTIE